MDNWLRKLRQRRGMTQAEVAKQAGTSQQQIDRIEKGERRLTVDWIRTLAPIYGVEPSSFLEQGDEPRSQSAIRVVGSVEAGVWREALEWPFDDQYEIPIGTDQDHPGVPRFSLVVRGSSMNRVMPEGTLLICAKTIDLGDPEPEDYVIALRRRADGLVEGTVKQFSVDSEGKPWLWPRSDHPAHQAPIELRPGKGDEEVSVYAVVLDYTVKARKRRGAAQVKRRRGT